MDHTQKEKCLVLLKPDCIERRLTGELITRIEKTGLRMVRMKMITVTEDLIGRHYPHDPSWLKSVGLKKIQKYSSIGKPISQDPLLIGERVRKNLMAYFVKKTVVALVIEGNNAIACLRKIAGNTEPLSALPGTLRGDYSTDSYEIADATERPVQNLVHVSDSPEASQREIAIWFPEETAESRNP